jgi:titin
MHFLNFSKKISVLAVLKNMKNVNMFKNNCMNSISVPDVPSSPRKLRLMEVTRSNIAITWEAPDMDGGAPINGYIIERCQGYSTRFTRVNRQLVTDTSYNMDDVREGEEYEIQILAENAEGVSKPSNSCGPVRAKDPFGECH